MLQVQYWLCLLRDSKLAEQTTINNLLDEVTEIANMLAAGVIKLKKKTF